MHVPEWREEKSLKILYHSLAALGALLILARAGAVLATLALFSAVGAASSSGAGAFAVCGRVVMSSRIFNINFLAYSLGAQFLQGIIAVRLTTLCDWLWICFNTFSLAAAQRYAISFGDYEVYDNVDANFSMLYIYLSRKLHSTQSNDRCEAIFVPCATNYRCVFCIFRLIHELSRDDDGTTVCFVIRNFENDWCNFWILDWSSPTFRPKQQQHSIFLSHEERARHTTNCHINLG